MRQILVIQCVLTVLLLFCVWWGEGRAERVLTAQVEVVTKGEGGSDYNTTYFFGLYGSNSLIHPVSGHLVHVVSESGRNDGCTTYNQSLPDHDWVALIERGLCYFEDKVRIATKQHNASAVIIYDNQHSSQLLHMHIRIDNEVYIFMKQSMGRRLAILLDSGLDVHVNITPTYVSVSLTSSADNIHSWHPLAIATLVFLLAWALQAVWPR